MKNRVVFLSGLLCNETVWEKVAKKMQTNFDISFISFQGCDSIEMMAKKVLDTVPDKCILIGHSMGGRVALEVYHQNPERIEALGLFNTGVHPKSDDEIPKREKLLNLAKKEGVKAVCEVWLPPMMAKDSLKNELLMKKLEQMVNSYSVEDFYNQISALLNRPNAQKVLPKIEVPTLLLSGTQDTWSPIYQHKQMQKILKYSTLVEIENAGHMAPVEKPFEVANAILKWIQNLQKI